MPAARAALDGVGCASGMTIRKAYTGEGPAIARLVRSHPGASLYHLPVFAELLRRAARLTVEQFVAWEGGRLVGVLPVALTKSPLFGTFATSLPLFNYGGVLTSQPDAGMRLARAAWRWARSRGARSLILRHGDGRDLDLPALRTKETVLLDVGGSREALWQRIGSKTRNLVRKAARADQRATLHGAEALPAFHRVYAENMRDLGTPSLGEAFFHDLFAGLGERARVHLVRLASTGEVVAASITLRSRDRVEVPWASGVRRLRHLSGVMLLYWSMLRYAHDVGASAFDFGRGTPGSGSFRFKLQWRGERQVLPWYYFAAPGCEPGGLSPDNPKYALAIRSWQRLPLGLTRILGALLARQLP